MSPIEASPAAVGAWWGYAEADPTIVGVLVAAVVILAFVHVARRVRSERAPGHHGRRADSGRTPRRRGPQAGARGRA